MSSEPTAVEARFLEGPRPRGSELLWALGTFAEFIRGFRARHFVGPCVTVFGSARFKEDHPYYQLAREIGYGLAAAVRHGAIHGFGLRYRAPKRRWFLIE